MYITKDVAAKMESCIKQTHIEVTRLYSQGVTFELNGGAACFSGFDSFLSQVVGWGFSTDPKQFVSEITALEHFYKSLNHPRVDIELCPYVGNPLAAFLSQRGYRLSELNNVSVLDLKDYKLVDCAADEFFISQVHAKDINEWAKKMADSFGYPEAREQFSYYARAKGVNVFGAYHQGKLLAGATVALHGTVCDLGVTSTLPAYRGLGIQKKLLCARLNFAKQQGLELATVTTEPGTISDLNVQKIGFRSAYTRIKMTLES